MEISNKHAMRAASNCQAFGIIKIELHSKKLHDSEYDGAVAAAVNRAANRVLNQGLLIGSLF